MFKLGLGLQGYTPSAIAFDSDAAAFFATAGVTDATAKSQINDFVKGVKSLGLYNNMVCWPLRSSQNAGTGTTAYSLGGLGTFNGTLTNGPTWGTDGIVFDGSNDFINTGNPLNTARIVYVSYKTNLAGALNASVVGNYNFNGSTETGYELIYIASTQPAIRFYTATNNANARQTTVNCADTNFHFAMGITDNTASRISVDGTTGAFTNLTNPPRVDSTGNFAIGAGSVSPRQPINSTISFVAVMDLYTTQFDSVRTLYKTTLGQGLGLP
jgi:hypothetical protein